MARTPPAEVDVDEELVRRLLADQHPDLADLPLTRTAAGWDNVMWRLGDALAVRLPRRQVGATLTENEQRWLPEIFDRVSAATSVLLPAPLRYGRPTAYYPWHWSVVVWIQGRSAATVAPPARRRIAEPLAALLPALHVPAPADAPDNPFRSRPLATRDEVVRDRIGALDLPAAPALLELWSDLVRTAPWSAPAVWIHGDLHPHNLILDGTRQLTGVIDFGDMTAGDPATDLATAWMTFDRSARRTFREHLEGHYDDATWRRGRAWALSMATAMVTMSDDDPVIAAVGRHTFEQVLEGD
ncbi:aminoglycoside phosphotransferase family protein [Georgenia deserti]|uniref:Aminoglycoside phosphotransferase family protein n=1 Tax=Georgenia deserti TaxID=2093781 RepID=A0ABW4L9Y5_9MICO